MERSVAVFRREAEGEKSKKDRLRPQSRKGLVEMASRIIGPLKGK